MRSKQLPGLPVLTLDDGVQLGKVKKVLVDPREKRVAALIVGQRGWNQQKVLPMSGVYALGSHAVTIERGDVLVAVRDAHEYEALIKEDRTRVVGSPVVTTSGELVGTVRDFEVTGTGSVEALYIGKGSFPSFFRRAPAIPGELVVALGKDAVLVADKVIAMVEGDEPKTLDERPRPDRKPFQLFTWPKESAKSEPDKE